VKWRHAEADHEAGASGAGALREQWRITTTNYTRNSIQWASVGPRRASCGRCWHNRVNSSSQVTQNAGSPIEALFWADRRQRALVLGVVLGRLW
jgi:hypothetical protein